MRVDFSIDYMKILEADEDTALVELDLLHTGKNRNQYYIGKEAVEKAIPTIYNKPIIYRLNNEFIPEMATDVVEHGTMEDRSMRIAGTIPESAPMEFVQRDGKEYLRTKGVIYKIYQPSLMNILKNRNGNVKVSIEIYVTDHSEDTDGSWIINDFRFEGVALLGEGILEGIEGSQMNVIKFSAKELNDHYLGFSAKKIPDSVKKCVKDALALRESRGKGGSSASVSMAKYLSSNDYIDYARLECMQEYFSKKPNNKSITFSLYGGDSSQEWISEISNGRKVNSSMKNISVDYVCEKIRSILRNMGGEEQPWRYWINSVYIEPKRVVISDDVENKIYLVDYAIEEDNEISIFWDTKKEMIRCYIPVEDVDDNTLLFKQKEVLSIDENGQLISNTHRLSSVDSAVARKAETLLNGLEKEDEEVDEKKEFKSDEEEEKVDNCDVKNCDDTKLNAEDEAEKVEDEEKAEDRKEDDKEEDDEKEGQEDFKAKCDALMKENENLKECLNTYQKKEEVEKMNALIDEFSYCFTADEKAELVKNLDTKTFAEVEGIVNENVRKFAKENKPDDEDKRESKFSIGLLARNFSYKKDEKDTVNSLKDIKDKYSK